MSKSGIWGKAISAPAAANFWGTFGAPLRFGEFDGLDSRAFRLGRV